MVYVLSNIQTDSLIDRTMITIHVWTDDYKLLQESN